MSESPRGASLERGGGAAATPVLEARGLHKSYFRHGEEVPVLKGADLALEAGEFTVITGPSGSGKSTLLHLLGLVDEPTKGEIRLFGAATAGLLESERSRLRNRRLGFAFQFDSLLPDFTVLENVSMPGLISLSQGRGDWGDVAAVEARAGELLERFGIDALADRFPPEVSGGERQRAAVARALLNRPHIVLADEPTGNLDRANGETVLRCLKEAAESLGTAVLLVTHNDYAAAFASRTLKLSAGLLVETR